MILNFTYESRSTLKSFTLFITFKTITKLNLGHTDKFEIKFNKIAVVAHVFQTTQTTYVYTWTLYVEGRSFVSLGYPWFC